MHPLPKKIFSQLPFAKFIIFTLSLIFFSISLHGEIRKSSADTPADPPRASPLLVWSTADGASFEAAYERLNDDDEVVLRDGDNEEHSVPFSCLKPESRMQAQKLAGLPLISVLYLGDSMSLDGFGKQLDKNLRANPRVGSVWTFMACGTHPMSWMKTKPYSNSKTFCGFWSIESEKDSPKPRVVNESENYGSHKAGHFVPKIEDLLESLKPDVLIMQSGNNFFSIFSDHVTIKEERHGGEINYHVKSFVKYLATTPSSLRKVYWITPPQCGKVTEEIQQFVFDRIEENTRPLATLVDSRTMTHYPYPGMWKDKEHFGGKEPRVWADDAFDFMMKDLFVKPLASLPTIHDQAVAIGGWEKPSAPDPASPTIKVRATLIAKTPVPAPEKFAPYREFLVAFQYKIDKILEGKYAAEKLLVMHPAYIALKKQPLENLKVGKTYEMQLRELDKTSLWKLIRSDDASECYDLTPYILVNDEARHPDASTNRTALKSPVVQRALP